MVDDDGSSKNYSFLALATTPDGRRGDPLPTPGAGRLRLALRSSYRGRGCSRNRTLVLRLRGADAAAVNRLVVRYRGKVVARGRRSVTIRLRKLRGSGNLTATATLRDGRTRTFKRHLTLCTRRR
jgi:hypothetical protein